MTEKEKKQQPQRFSKDGKQITASLAFGENLLVGSVTEETSVGIPIWILTHPTLSSRAVRLWAYMRGAISGNLSIPGTSHRSIATLLDVSDSTAERTIYELRDAGALKIIHSFSNGRQVGNVYYLWPASVLDGPSPVSRGVLTSEEGYINTNTNIDISSKIEVKQRKLRKPRTEYPEAFEEMWKFYPRRNGKSDAFIYYKATIGRGVEAALLLEATKKYADSRKGKDLTYTMYGQTFFGQGEHWRQYIEDQDAMSVSVELTEEQKILARIYDLYDDGEQWIDVKNNEVRLDNPAKYGYARPVNAKGALLSGDGTTYSLDAQGVRRSGNYWLK